MKRKKIIYISYFFPPYRYGATVRTWNLCKALIAAGHEVEVITIPLDHQSPSRLDPPPDYAEIKHDTAYRETRIKGPLQKKYLCPPPSTSNRLARLVRRSTSGLLFRLLNASGLDHSLPWSLKAGWRLRGKKDADLIVATGGPFSTFITAWYLSKKLGCELVLDYRDVWNDPPYTPFFQLSQRTLEKKILRQASLVTSVSPSCLTSILGGVKRPSAMITNGVPPYVTDFRRYHDAPPTRSIVYAGYFYPPRSSVQPLFSALAELKQRGALPEDFRFVYLGFSSDYVLAAAAENDITELVDCRGAVPRDEALAIQAQAKCALVVTLIDEEAQGPDRGIITGKIFEAIELARKVLVISPVNSDVRLLTSDIPDVYHFTGRQTHQIAQWIEEHVLSGDDRPMDRSGYFAWADLSRSFTDAIEDSVADHA